MSVNPISNFSSVPCVLCATPGSGIVNTADKNISNFDLAAAVTAYKRKNLELTPQTNPLDQALRFFGSVFKSQRPSNLQFALV